MEQKKDEDWFLQPEQSAGKLRLSVMFFFYDILGKHLTKFIFFFVFLFIYPFCSSARKALKTYYRLAAVKPRTFYHLFSFACSAIDKIDACGKNKNPPRFEFSGDLQWMNGSSFLLSTHVGCIEVLPALKAKYPNAPRVHAFQQMGHNATFTNFFVKHLDSSRFALHAVEEIGVETAVEMKDAISRGEIVLMAGDRMTANHARARNEEKAMIFSHECRLPKGVFKFALLMEAPIYAIVCASLGRNTYEVYARKLSREALVSDYAKFLEDVAIKYPYQWYHFHNFFN